MQRTVVKEYSTTAAARGAPRGAEGDGTGECVGVGVLEYGSVGVRSLPSVLRPPGGDRAIYIFLAEAQRAQRGMGRGCGSVGVWACGYRPRLQSSVFLGCYSRADYEKV